MKTGKRLMRPFLRHHMEGTSHVWISKFMSASIYAFAGGCAKAIDDQVDYDMARMFEAYIAFHPRFRFPKL